MILALRSIISRELRDCIRSGTAEFRQRKQRTDEHTRILRDEEADVRTTWKFIPPGAPNMGGAWGVWCDLSNRVGRIERGALAKNSTHLLLEAEHIVNSRPLTEVDIEPADEGLTPSYHFLIPGAALPPGPLTTTCSSGLQTGARVSASPITSGRGRIKKTYPGPDKVRVVDVRTTGGVLRRPTSKIVVLVSAEATAVPCPEVLRTEGECYGQPRN
ncbi:hypothetical protein EVAR_41023_1 [Eumeta japonica]|uniref:DUF5641 domain-containing protein n=1 Tax=Eumeta variegata TaxID=151549 RepID=A0A4C1Z331_EUMVA|nr:hypothetical protein EVAR_41023_1 [Eumeta japonica]